MARSHRVFVQQGPAARLQARWELGLESDRAGLLSFVAGHIEAEATATGGFPVAMQVVGSISGETEPRALKKVSSTVGKSGAIA